MVYKSVDFDEQIEIFKRRKMRFEDEAKAKDTIKYISYYKIKEFAEPFAKVTNSTETPATINYNNVYFERVISRYYQDKNFRLHIMHAIEDIEVALQTQIAYVLGETTGDYGYLEFKNWADISTYSKSYVKDQEDRLKKVLRDQISKSNKRELKEKIKYGKNIHYPPVWLAMNELMFGQLIQLLKIMSKKNLKRISSYFNCSNDELVSWMRCLNLIRNISAHNSNLIDIKLRTLPITRREWDIYLYKYDEKVYKNRVSVPIVILKYLMDQINPKYKFGNISSAIQNLIQEEKATANYFGLESIETVKLIFPSHKNRWSVNRNKKRVRKRNVNIK